MLQPSKINTACELLVCAAQMTSLQAKAQETEHKWMDFEYDLQLLKQTNADLAARVRRLETQLCGLQS